MTPFKRVLIANRGEIAIRIARSAAALGIESVGVYSPLDTLSLHTRCTTKSVEIKTQDPAGAYLNAESLIQIALENGCDCVHPGYGFLSENAAFAGLCAAEDLTFIGPSPSSLALFGDKIQARVLARSLDIPVVPGSTAPLASPEEAIALTAKIGYPIMLKASAGGGGRGMRRVDSDAEMIEAFERCRSEAETAFGDGSVFLEKFIAQPRHIEVQILADHQGNVVHLHERDCSVQLRNQKVIETAPAVNLDQKLREQLFAAAIKLAKAADYRNAGTVEFLVSPETDEFYFIECNPRIQVEHTVTEQITGIDLVDTQFHLAAGASLASLGLESQQAIGSPRGFAVQARVVSQGIGAISAYKEPSGVGIRVDACGYLGYSPAPQFDPLLAKVIGYASSAASYSGAIDRTLRALEEFHIKGIPTNLLQLRAILSHKAVRSGDARTSLLTSDPDLSRSISPLAALDGAPERTLALLEQQATLMGTGFLKPTQDSSAQDTQQALPIAAGQRAIECPMTGTVVEQPVAVGDTVKPGDTVLIISAMKMETVITSPYAGVITAIFQVEPGDTVAEQQVVAVLTPDMSRTEQQTVQHSDQSWMPILDQVNTLRKMAERRLAPGSQDPGVVRQRSRGKLTCRERITLLLDEGSFREVGSIAGFTSYDDEGAISDFTPANHVGGRGKIHQRNIIVCADDFTSRGGHADGAVGSKARYLDRLALELLIPSIRLLDGSSGGGSVAAMVPKQKQQGESKAEESSGAINAGKPRVSGKGGSNLGGDLGGTMFGKQLNTIPVVNLLLGSVVGLGAAKAVIGHFSVMVRDVAQLFVAGPPVVRHAVGYDITKEDLGGWHIHCRNGSIDNLANTEQEAIELTRRFLSYLPTSVYEAPPRLPPNPGDPITRREQELLTIIPRKRTTTFNMHKAIKLMADVDSFFEIGPLWATDQITGFVRFNGYPMGVIASNSQHANGGAMTADGCDKLRRHLDLCDLFHLPVLNLVDNPGFAVGLEHEITGTIRKGAEWLIAFAQVQVPIFTVVMRRSFGVAGVLFATPTSRALARVVWPAMDAGGIPPEGGIEAAYKRQLAEAEDPAALREELYARIESVRGPLGPLNAFQAEELIDPRDTRLHICEWVEIAYEQVSKPARLIPRALGFRP